MKKLLFIFALLLANNNLILANPSCAFSDIEGTWEGDVVEGSANYKLNVVIDCTDGISSMYSDGLECGGSWTYVTRTANSITFDEVITTGPNACADGQLVVTKNEDGTLYWDWGNGIAIATLVKEVNPIPAFSQWRITSFGLLIIFLGAGLIWQRKSIFV